MAASLDVALPAAAALASAAGTYLLGRRSQVAKERAGAVEQWERLVRDLRAEVDRCQARVAALEHGQELMRTHMDEQDAQHDRDRQAWRAERRTLIRALRGEITPPPDL